MFHGNFSPAQGLLRKLCVCMFVHHKILRQGKARVDSISLACMLVLLTDKEYNTKRRQRDQAVKGSLPYLSCVGYLGG